MYEPYLLDLQTLELDKSVQVEATLQDVRSGKARIVVVLCGVKETVEVGRSLHETDRARLEGRASYISTAEARELQRSLPALDRAVLGQVAQAFAVTPVSTAPTAFTEPSALPSADGVRAPADEPPPSAALVSVEGLGGAGKGVYVTPDHILTARSLIGTTSLIKVVAAAGMATYGVLEREDAANDLAVIYVPKPGEPVALVTANEKARAAWDAVPGTPVFRGGKLAGIAVTDVPEGTVTGGPLLAITQGLEAAHHSPARPGRSRAINPAQVGRRPIVPA